MDSLDALLTSARPRFSVQRGRAGIVVLAAGLAFKLQCVRRLDGAWWSEGWDAAGLINMVNVAREVALMEWGARAGVAPAFHGSRVYAKADLPPWLLAVLGPKACEKVLVTVTAKVAPLGNVTLASVRRVVEACAAKGVAFVDLRPDNLGTARGKLVVVDWGETHTVSPALARRFVARDLEDALGRHAPPAALAYLRSVQ